MSSKSLGRISTAPTNSPSCMGDMGGFNSPLRVRSFKDLTPLLGFRLLPPYTSVNDVR